MRAALGAACIVALCGCGSGGTKSVHEIPIGRKSATGKHASATALGKAGTFGNLSVWVTAAPNQRVTGNWTIACRQGTTTWRNADDFRGPTPLRVLMRPTATPAADCTVQGTAALANAGRVTVKLLAR